MSLPTFLIVGPFKSGTTWIHEYLQERQDICLPLDVKETFFFDRHHEKPVNWYKSHFKHFDSDLHIATCEVAPSYLHAAGLPERVRAALGVLPIVILNRDAVSRSWSHYLHMRRKGYTRSNVINAVREFPSILDASRVEKHASHWREVMGADNVHVLSFDELENDPAQFVERLCKELNLPLVTRRTDRLQPSNVAGVSRSYLLAKLSRKGGELLRRHRLHRAVSLAKTVKLHRIVYSGGTVDTDPTLVLDGPTKQWLHDALQDEFDTGVEVSR